MENFITFIELIYPFLLAFIPFICIFCIKEDEHHEVIFSPFGLFKIRLHIGNKILPRIILGIVVILLIFSHAFRDFSSFFPERYEMEVFYDISGIESSFDFYTTKEIESLCLNENWRIERDEFLEILSKELSNYLKIDDFFDYPDNIYSTGSTNFVVEKCSEWQKYHITKSEGGLRHVLDRPRFPIRAFYSSFELQPSSNNYIRASLVDLYLKYTKVLRPCFKQIAYLNLGGGEIIYSHSIMALIKIRFFPVIKIYDTIYLVESTDDQSWFPIGYAVYTPIR